MACRDETRALCCGGTESQPLDSQGSPSKAFLKKKIIKLPNVQCQTLWGESRMVT